MPKTHRNWQEKIKNMLFTILNSVAAFGDLWVFDLIHPAFIEQTDMARSTRPYERRDLRNYRG